MGIASSGVRVIAESWASGDVERASADRLILKRVSWIAGIAGWLLTAALSYPLSQWTFGSHEHALAVAVLGASLLFTTVSSAQLALIQGMRRIGDIARIQILSMIVGSVVAIGLYAWLKEKGIVPVLITSAVISYAFTRFYSSRVPLAAIALDWKQTWHGSKRLIGLGAAFMWSAILAAGVAFATRSIIVRDLGIEANGIFQAAWGISGMFAGFILSAMGTDFYPRLTAASHDHAKMNQMVNEQTEIAILLALPGLMGTLVFAPWLMKIFYTAKFIEGSVLLPWFVLGVFFKVVSWPMGFIMLAKGETRWFVISESLFNIFQIGLTIYLIKAVGLAGAAYAFATLFGLHILAMLLLSHSLSAFCWSGRTSSLLVATASMVTLTFFLQKYAGDIWKLSFGTLLVIMSTVFSLRGIVSRLGKSSRVPAMIAKLPYAGLLFGTDK
jgi:PST family polysaccharide transporter